MLGAMTDHEVHDRASFAHYVAQLIAELDDPALSEKWENVDLRSFLSEMEAWAIDSDGPADPNPWRHAAHVLQLAKYYE